MMNIDCHCGKLLDVDDLKNKKCSECGLTLEVTFEAGTSARLSAGFDFDLSNYSNIKIEDITDGIKHSITQYDYVDPEDFLVVVSFKLKSKSLEDKYIIEKIDESTSIIIDRKVD